MVPPLDPNFADFLRLNEREVTPLALALREIVLTYAPEALERTFANHPHALWYGHGPRMEDMALYIAMASRHVNLGFCRGAMLPDPARVLEGTGKVMRHLKFRGEDDLDRPFLADYIRAAWRAG
jgi:hypothetical protein